MDKSDPSHEDGASLPRVGDLVAGKYEVERIIGEGGMGVVVAARHRELGELVAIKLLRPHAARDGEAVARLMREARATISIKSEHVVRIIDVGQLDSGSHYILMEFLRGSDLGEVVRDRGQLPVADAVDYLLQACEAIAEAHARGIVHRDLKPSNLFLTQRADGSSLVKVLDFGISKALVAEDASVPGSKPQASLTATKAVFGSPLYMSPEQVRSSKRVDERTDVWALGIILHELLTGSLPFGGEAVQAVLAAIVADAPELVRVRRPDVPEGLERVIASCLVKDVVQRCQSVAELATALRPYAPPGAEVSIERIVRLALPGSVSQRLSDRPGPSFPPAPRSGAELVSQPASTLALEPTVQAASTTSVATSEPRRGARFAVRIGVAVAVACAAGLMTSVLWHRPARPVGEPSSAVLPVGASPPPPALPAPAAVTAESAAATPSATTEALAPASISPQPLARPQVNKPRPPTAPASRAPGAPSGAPTPPRPAPAPGMDQLLDTR